MRRLVVASAWLGLVAAGTLALSGCLAGGAASGGRSATPGPPVGRGFREYLVRPGVMQLFLPPQRLEGTNHAYAELDLVVRDSSQVPLSSLLHLSIVAPTAAKIPGDTLLLTTSGRPLALTARALYTEPAGKATLTRLEAYLTPAQTSAYLQSPAKAVLLGGPAGRQRFEPTKKALAALQAFATRAVGASGQ